MKVLKKQLFLLLLIAFKSFALTASVQDVKGKLLEGVEITFSNSDTTLYTNATGSFDFVKEVPVVSSHTIVNEIKLTFKTDNFTFSIPNKANVSIAMFNLRGQEIMSFKELMSRGVKNISVPKLSSGFYILHVKVGDLNFTKKFLFTSGSSWSSVLRKNETLVSQRTSRATIIDTVFFNITGYNQEYRTITSYNQDLGKVVLVDGLYAENWYGFEAFDIDTVLPNFVNILFRAYDSIGYGIPNIDTSKFVMLEDGDPITSESEVTIERASAFADTIKTVLLLDHSTSVKDNLEQIKAAAKVMVRNIAPSQQIAIYAFSEDATKVVDFTHDTTALLDGIDIIPLGSSSTNLYGSLLKAFTLISNYASVLTKTIMYGNVVLFTDGKDTQASSTLQQVLSSQGDRQVFSLGLGNELDTVALKEISGEFLFTTTDVSELAALFGDIQEKISMMANSYYWAHYRSPKRGDKDHTIKMEVAGNSNVAFDATISGTFNSGLFSAGLAPTVDSVNIILNDTEDTLIGYYEYYDSEGEVEGESNFQWKINGVVIDSTSNKIPYSLLKNGDKVIFNVQPVSLFGSPNVGLWKACTVNVMAPEALGVRVTRNATSDTLIGTYTYHVEVIDFIDDSLWNADTNKYSEGESIIEWYLDDSLIATGLTLPATTLEANNSLTLSSILSFRVTPVSKGGIPKSGKTITYEKNVTMYFPAPRVSSIKIQKLYPTIDLLYGYYRYDGVNPEGETIKEWYLNGLNIGTDIDTIKLDSLDDNLFINGLNELIFSVTPVAEYGLFTEGEKKDDTLNFQRYLPTAMVLIPAKDSSFIMGCSTSNNSHEKPLHTVSFTYDFWMTTTEITQGEFDALMSDSVYGYKYYQTPIWDSDPEFGTKLEDKLPAYNINWYEAALFCNAQSKFFGKDTVYSYSSMYGQPGGSGICSLYNVTVDFNKNGYRLPTEAEWEYACRAGTQTDTYWGNENIDDYAWYDSISHMTLQEVGLKKANAFGLFDMIGNIDELCNDLWGAFDTASVVDPYGPTENSSGFRSVRGGAFLLAWDDLRSARRIFYPPSYRKFYTGFRCALPVN